MIGDVDGDASGGSEGVDGGTAEESEGHKFETFDIAGFVDMSKPLCR